MSEPASYNACMYELGIRPRNSVSAKKVKSDRGRLLMSSSGLHTNAQMHSHIPVQTFIYTPTHIYTYRHLMHIQVKKEKRKIKIQK